jgi:Cysteine-rich secretory protein family
MKKILVGAVVIAVLVGAGFLIKDLLFSGVLKLEKGVNDLLQESEKKVFLPSPLISEQNAPDSFLDREGIINLTNSERQKEGLAPLKDNRKLDASSQIKLEDIFAKQYFEHTSPSGVDVSGLAGQTGYEFIILGENLAMGNFEDDQALVDAWMSSPGHRANILNPNFTEIGVSVSRGIFNGKLTWIAVQHFGTPLSTCPVADETIKSAIEADEKEISSIEQTLNSLKDEIKTGKDVKQYNDLVLRHNKLVDQTKSLIDKYNEQVRTFNQCLTQIVQTGTIE